MKKLRIDKMATFIMVASLVLILGCEGSFQHFGEFTIRYMENGCKEITDGIGRKLLLVPGNRNSQPGYENPNMVAIPVKKVVVYSTTIAARIESLGEAKSIVGVVTKQKDWHIPEIKKGLEKGEIEYLGEYRSIDYERLRVLNPDVVFTWDEGAIPKLNELGIPCVITSPKIAPSLFAHIEFIQFLSAFYNEEKKARGFVENQIKKINEVSTKIDAAEKSLKVVWGDIYEKKVLVEPGNSWAAQIVERAGGNYVFHDLEGAA